MQTPTIGKAKSVPRLGTTNVPLPNTPMLSTYTHGT